MIAIVDAVHELAGAALGVLEAFEVGAVSGVFWGVVVEGCADEGVGPHSALLHNRPLRHHTPLRLIKPIPHAGTALLRNHRILPPVRDEKRLVCQFGRGFEVA